MVSQHDIRRYPGTGWVTFVFFLWLYAPIAVVIWFSFNENRLVSIWTGFSTKWYAAALTNASLLEALKTSLIIALVATTVSTLVALSAAMVLSRTPDLKFRQVSETVANLPLLLPEIVVAVATLILFSQLEFTNGMLRLIVAHTTFCTPFAFLPIRARLQGMNTEYEEAARDLYATPFTTFRRVTLPMILPGVFAGAMLAFVISMDDFITSNMLSTGGTTTLPVYIFSLIKKGASPQLNAISTLLILASLVIATTALAMSARALRRE